MQEINLLQNKLKDSTVVWEKRNKIIVNLLILILILEAVGIGAFMTLANQTDSKYQKLKSENQSRQTVLNQKQSNLTSAKVFQAQLKNLRFVTDSHIFWSSFFDELGKNTFNKSQFVSINVDTAGKVHLEGMVGSYNDLGKLMLGLSTWDKVSDVSLLSSNPSQSDVAGYVFSIDFKVSPEIFVKK